MKFIVGELPIDITFNPQAEGWLALTKPSFWSSYLFNTVGPLIIGGVFLLGINLLLVVLTGQGFFGDSVYEYYLPVIFSFLVIPLAHEFIRIPVVPLPKDSIDVVMPNQYLVWLGLAFTAELNRKQMLLILALPFLLISLVPVFVGVIFGINSPWLSVPAFMNGIASSTDAILIFHLLRQTSKDSQILAHGFDIYYKMGQSQVKDV